MNFKEPKIVDLTIKEGGFSIAHHWKLEQVAELAQELKRAGLKYVEVSHGCGIGGLRKGFPGLHNDKELLKAARKSAPELKYCVYLDSGPQSVTETELVSDLFEIGRIGVNAWEIKKISEHLRQLKHLRKTPFVQLLRIHSLPPEKVAEAAASLEDQGAEAVYLVDSFGSMDSEDIARYFDAVGQRCRLPLGFQGRNNTHRAVSNAMAAWRAGAEWFDVSLLGIGRDSGITNSAILLSLLHREGFAKHLDAYELNNAGWHYLLPMLKRIPIVGYLDLLFAKHRIDIYPKEFLQVFGRILEMTPERIIERLRQLNPEISEIDEGSIRDLLQSEKLNYEVVMEYIRTGQIPIASQ